MPKRHQKNYGRAAALPQPATVPTPTPVQLPRRRPALLVVCSILIVAWIAFLAAMAFRS